MNKFLFINYVHTVSVERGLIDKKTMDNLEKFDKETIENILNAQIEHLKKNEYNDVSFTKNMINSQITSIEEVLGQLDDIIDQGQA